MKLRIVWLFLVLVVFISCKSDNCLKSTGDIIEKRIDLSSFQSIEIYDVFNVQIKQDSISYVIIEAGENIIDGIICEISDTSLIIESNNGCNWLRPFDRPNILIGLPDVNLIVLHGESDIYSVDTLYSDELILSVYSGASGADLILDCNIFKFSLNQGTGNFYFHGETTVSYIYTIGTGNVYAEGLRSYYSNITNNSTGDIYLMVEEVLDVKLRSSGDIYYYGDPATININEQSSSGELIKLED